MIKISYENLLGWVPTGCFLIIFLLFVYVWTLFLKFCKILSLSLSLSFSLFSDRFKICILHKGSLLFFTLFYVVFVGCVWCYVMSCPLHTCSDCVTVFVATFKPFFFLFFKLHSFFLTFQCRFLYSSLSPSLENFVSQRVREREREREWERDGKRDQ